MATYIENGFLKDSSGALMVIGAGGGGGSTSVSISGDAVVGATLTAAGATEDSTLQWYRDAVAISGATSTTYVVQAVDQGHDIVCKATDPSNAITIPPGGGTGVTFSGNSVMRFDKGAVDISNTAYTLFVLWQPVGSDGTGWTLLAGESAVSKAHWAMYRLGTGGFWTANSIGLYRYWLPPSDNEDLVWTTDITAVLADGLMATFVAHPLGGGVGNEPYVSNYVRSGGAWVHDTSSPTRMNFQMGRGDPLGDGGRLLLGQSNGTNGLNGTIYAAAIWHDVITDHTALMSAHTTEALLATNPVWAVDASSNLEVDLTANGGDFISQSNTTQAAPLSDTVWTMGA